MRGEHISFYVVFVAAVYRPSSRVDYTDIEEERLREKKGKMYVFPITSSAAHYREREEVLCEK